MGVRRCGSEVNAMRVNIEDDLHLSGRLPAFARFLGVDEDTAIGRLYWVYRETQSRELVTMTRAEFVAATELRLLNPGALLDALLRSRLASEHEGFVTIHGNQVHVDRISKMRGMASAGGKARQHGKRSGNPTASAPQPDRSRSGNRSAADTQAPSKRSLLPAPSSLLQKQDPDLKPDPNLPVTIKKSDLSDLHRGVTPGAQQPTGASAIRLTYLNAYARKFARPFVGWGVRENGQCKNLLGSWPIERVLELIPLYFAWNNPIAIRAGYPFGFFVSSIHELDTDTHAPERKRLAAAAMANERQVGNEDAEKIRTESKLTEFVDKFAREVTEAKGQVTTSIGTQNPVKQPVKQLLSLSGVPR